MTPELLFLYCLGELDRYVRPRRSPYDYLQIARILRQLLLDRPGPADEVNRHHRIPWEFRVNLARLSKSERRHAWISVRMDGIDPDTFSIGKANIATLGRDQFLSVEVMSLEGVSITVKDLIRHCANQKGAVHSQRPRTDKDKVLDRVGNALKFGDIDAATRALVPIGILTLKAIRPLATRVRNELLSQNKFPAELVNVTSDSDVWQERGWGVSCDEEVPVTLQVSALPERSRIVARGRPLQIRGEFSYIKAPAAKKTT